jgi:hypothetical protein
MDLVALAKRLLANKKLDIPETDAAVLQAAYEALKEEDFIQAHIFRLNKERQDFTKEDWASILELSGEKKCRQNIAAFMACLSRGLISAEETAEEASE